MKGLSEIWGTGEDANLGSVVFTGHLSSFPKIKEGASDHLKAKDYFRWGEYFKNEEVSVSAVDGTKEKRRDGSQGVSR
jgi:hypothetical protein